MVECASPISSMPRTCPRDAHRGINFQPGRAIRSIGGNTNVVADTPQNRHNQINMALSARNQFHGKIASIRAGSIMSEVVIDTGGGHQIVSLISTSSVKRLKLKKGSAAVAVIKATEVIVSTNPSTSEG
jgi:molybdopterin-binding protein